jgi:hypothetical protein
MGTKRVVWHVGFGRLLRRRGPSSFEVREEVPLSEEALRMDYLLLRKLPASAADTEAQTLRRLWALLPQLSIVEYKSPGRTYRTGNLDRLLGYVHTYYAGDDTRPNKRGDLCAVLVVPSRTPSLNADVKDLGFFWEDLREGYFRVRGGPFALYVVEIDVAGPAENDDLLYSMGNGIPTTPEARWFWTELVGSQEAGMSVRDLEGYNEVMLKLLDTLPPEQVLSHYGPQQVLSHYTPEQRLADLDRDHQALALPLEVLRLLPKQYIRSLSAEVQAELERRLQSADK